MLSSGPLQTKLLFFSVKEQHFCYLPNPHRGTGQQTSPHRRLSADFSHFSMKWCRSSKICLQFISTARKESLLYLWQNTLNMAGGLSNTFLSLGPVVKGFELCSALWSLQREDEGDDEELRTINHGWCHPPQSLWPAPLWSRRCDSPKMQTHG